jgi:hypothetical protein
VNKLKHFSSFIFLIFLIFQDYKSCAQTDTIIVNDTIIQDSSTLVEKPSKTKPYNFRKSFGEDYPHPKTATYAALLIPGAGQIYNKDWWKVPIVWGAYGAVGYSIYYNYTEYQRFNKAVILLLRNEPNEFPGVPVGVLRTNRDGFRKYLEYSYLGAVLIHLLSATEAFVAAHLHDFDISDDLSLRITPSIQTYPGNIQPMQAGLAMHFSF